jgi:replicative DNA helicase
LASIDYNLERGLPAAPDAEKSVLGAILLDNHLIDQAASSIKPEDFCVDAHRRIFQRMMDLSETGRPIDIITLSEELSRHKELEAVGGVAYISSLTDGVPRRPSIEHYVAIVRDKSLLRSAIHTASSIITRAAAQEETAEEVLDSAEAAIFQLSDARLNQNLMPIDQVARESFGGSLDALYKRGSRITGLETHYADLDELTSGLQPSDLIIIAARPSMGKTAFAINIAENAAVQDAKIVAIFSLEMSREALLLRMLCSQARVDSHKMRTGFLGRDDMDKLRKAYDALINAPIYIDDTPGISISEMRSKSRRLKQTQGRLDLVVVDYLQLMSGTPIGGKRFENRTQEVSAISRGLKAIAKELRVPVVALSQLSRAPETRGTKDAEPKLSDLRESGSIEQDADVVTFIYRPEYYDRDNPDLEGKAKLIIDHRKTAQRPHGYDPTRIPEILHALRNPRPLRLDPRVDRFA